MIETVELTLSHVDLGYLNDFSLVNLFANALSHRITQDRGISIAQLADVEGRKLYPAYYYTHLKVPMSRPLDQFNVWDTVDVGADVRSFGGLILDSRYVLGRRGEIQDTPDQWDLDAFPSMRAGTLMVLDENRETPQASVPRAELLAELPKLSAPPDSVKRFNELQAQAGWGDPLPGNLRCKEPFRYPLLVGRDLCFEHSVTCSSLIRIIDLGERMLLSEQQSPPMAPTLVDRRSLVERETYFFANCTADQILRIHVQGQVSPCSPSDRLPQSSSITPIGLVSFSTELRIEGKGTLVALSRSKKLLAVPQGEREAAERQIGPYLGSLAA